MKRFLIPTVVVACAVLAAGSVQAQNESLAGDWTFTAEHLNLKLVVEQKKSAITGTLDWPHGDPVKLTGIFADETLVLSGTTEGENFALHVDVSGTRKKDGTLTGTLKAHFDEFNDAKQIVRTRNQEIPWTAVRGLHDIMHFPRDRP